MSAMTRSDRRTLNTVLILSFVGIGTYLVLRYLTFSFIFIKDNYCRTTCSFLCIVDRSNADMSYTVLLQYNAKIIDNSETIRNYGWIEINTF